MLGKSSRSKEPTCLSEVYRELENIETDFYGCVRGKNVENVEVVVEKIEDGNKIDKLFGFKKAWVRCKDDCGEKCYVRFLPGIVKNKDDKGGFTSGDMK